MHMDSGAAPPDGVGLKVWTPAARRFGQKKKVFLSERAGHSREFLMTWPIWEVGTCSSRFVLGT